MKKINWGMIGCGDVTEVKSGPAFNKVPNSALVAVMRRDAAKAQDYAARHQVPKWYSSAEDLINDPDVNAIYVATPPSSHYQYALAAIGAGKPVYVEKPMTANVADAIAMAAAAKKQNVKMVVAHYRRQMPYFKKLKQLLDEQIIGEPLFARMVYYTRPLTLTELAVTKTAWRVEPTTAGGGLFHDLAPHQLDLMYQFFGEAITAKGIATNQAGLYAADDFVAGNILFKSGVAFSGVWSFAAPSLEEKDFCEIIGTKGKISFCIFNMKTITVIANGVTDVFSFDTLQHVQQPMIEETVKYFLDEAPNPCTAEEGSVIMQWMDAFINK
jgi:predicted dehydrogenase